MVWHRCGSMVTSEMVTLSEQVRVRERGREPFSHSAATTQEPLLMKMQTKIECEKKCSVFLGVSTLHRCECFFPLLGLRDLSPVDFSHTHPTFDTSTNHFSIFRSMPFSLLLTALFYSFSTADAAVKRVCCSAVCSFNQTFCHWHCINHALKLSL